MKRIYRCRQRLSPAAFRTLYVACIRSSIELTLLILSASLLSNTIISENTTIQYCVQRDGTLCADCSHPKQFCTSKLGHPLCLLIRKCVSQVGSVMGWSTMILPRQNECSPVDGMSGCTLVFVMKRSITKLQKYQVNSKKTD